MSLKFILPDVSPMIAALLFALSILLLFVAAVVRIEMVWSDGFKKGPLTV